MANKIMIRYAAMGAAAVLAAGALGLALAQSTPDTQDIAATPATVAEAPPVAEAIPALPSQAVADFYEKPLKSLTKPEKRMRTADRDRDGVVSRTEFLRQRQQAFDRLDANGDGTLQFSEYAVKRIALFETADRNKDKGLNMAELNATIKPVRKKADPCAAKESGVVEKDEKGEE